MLPKPPPTVLPGGDPSIQMPESIGDNSFNNHTSDAENYPGGSGNQLKCIDTFKDAQIM